MVHTLKQISSKCDRVTMMVEQPWLYCKRSGQRRQKGTLELGVQEGVHHAKKKVERNIADKRKTNERPCKRNILVHVT